MIFALSLILGAAVAITLIPLCVFTLQLVLASLAPPARRFERPAPTRLPGKRVAILVPAHNESANVVPTLKAILGEVTPDDRVIVIADNCNDDTAEHARMPGIEVIERFNNTERGKGYALDFGWRHALKTGTRPDYALILDADCILHPGGLNALLHADKGDHRPIQALYLCENVGETTVKQRIAEFAWRIRNWARALGYARVGLPCQMTGSGMLIPAACLERHALASGHLVEDLQLGLELAGDGMPPKLCDAALVTSTFPSSEDAQTAQRTRWEHGHLSIIVSALPGAVRAWARRPRLAFAALILDAAVPPLTLLLTLSGAIAGVAVAWGAATDTWTPAAAMGAGWIAMTLALGLGWMRYGRDLIRGGDVAHAIGYIFWKLPVYFKFLVARQTEWVRTKRDRD